MKGTLIKSQHSDIIKEIVALQALSANIAGVTSHTCSHMICDNDRVFYLMVICSLPV